MTRTGTSLLYCALLLAATVQAQENQRLSPDEALRAFSVADGLSVTTFASEPEIVSISNLDVDHRGRVWACECVNYRGNNGKRPAGDRILILEDVDGDGVSDKTTVFYQGRDIDIAMGLCVLGNKAIVSVAPEILLLEDTDGDDRADKKTVLFTSDAEYQMDHSLHSFVFGPDGRFYGNFGNTGRNLKDVDGRLIVDRAGNAINDNGQPYLGGMVFRCDRDFSNFEVLGHNFRNNYEATVDSFGGVWQSDNDDDGNLAVRLNYILEGGNYGYREELTGERWQKPRIGAHPHRGKRHWHQNDPGVVPNVIETGNGAPTCVTVYEGRLLPEPFHDQVIFCDAGPHVVWCLPTTSTGAGFAASKLDIARSPDNNFRPVDVAVAPDGSLIVSDWYDPVVGGFAQEDIERGRIYRIAPPNHKYSSPQLDLETAAGAVDALSSPNYCARYLAWTKLHDMGADAEAALAPMSKDSNPRMRARALWLLAQIRGREDEYIGQALDDDDPNVRVVGLRVADLLRRDVVAVIERLADDPSPRVRAECAVQLRHFHSERAAQVWARLAVQLDHDRWYLEALGIGADGKWDDCLSAYEALSGAIETPAGRSEIIWRSRGASTSGKLAQLLVSSDDLDAQRRYMRAFDFQSSEGKDGALQVVIFEKGLSDEIVLAAIERLSADRLQSDPRIRSRLIELLKRSRITSNSLRLIRQHRLKELSHHLLQVAQQPDNELRVDAMKLLLSLGQIDLLADALSDNDKAVVENTATTMAKTASPAVIALLERFVTDEAMEPAARRQVARDLTTSTRGAERMIELIKSGTLSGDLQEAVAGGLLLHNDNAVRLVAKELIPSVMPSTVRPLPDLSELLAMDGDPAKGRVVYREQGKCITCHQLLDHNATEGKPVGPDLSQIGTKLARSALFEAILYPSAAISHNYETYTALTDSGEIITGLLVNQTDDFIQLRDAGGNLRTVERGEIDEFRKQRVSLMPSNVHESMTSQQLVDLVQYLTTLKAEVGFVPMFNEKNLAGWTCSPLSNSDDWWAEDKMLVGQTDGRGSYLAWTGGGELRNFDARFSYRIVSEAANTGLQVRSKLFPKDWPYPLKGYQADIGHVGIGPKVLGGWDFHGQPRGDVLVQRGDEVLIGEDGNKTFTPLPDAVRASDIRAHDWNDVRVVAEDDTMTFYINNKIASRVIDLEVGKRVDEGYLGLQLHSGDGCRVEFRNLRVRVMNETQSTLSLRDTRRENQ